MSRNVRRLCGFLKAIFLRSKEPSYELKESAFYSLMPQKIRSALKRIPGMTLF